MNLNAHYLLSHVYARLGREGRRYVLRKSAELSAYEVQIFQTLCECIARNEAAEAPVLQAPDVGAYLKRVLPMMTASELWELRALLLYMEWGLPVWVVGRFPLTHLDASAQDAVLQ